VSSQQEQGAPGGSTKHEMTEIPSVRPQGGAGLPPWGWVKGVKIWEKNRSPKERVFESKKGWVTGGEVEETTTMPQRKGKLAGLVARTSQ